MVRAGLHGIGLFLLAFLGAEVGHQSNPENFGGMMLPMVSAALYVYGSILDSHSTLGTLRLMKQADNMGIRHSLEEGNILLPNRPSPDNFFLYPKTYVVDSMLVGLAAAAPTIGIPLALARGLAALNNYRKAQRLELAIKIASGDENAS